MKKDDETTFSKKIIAVLETSTLDDKTVARLEYSRKQALLKLKRQTNRKSFVALFPFKLFSNILIHFQNQKTIYSNMAFACLAVIFVTTLNINLPSDSDDQELIQTISNYSNKADNLDYNQLFDEQEDTI